MLADSFVSRKDRIIASAIDIISELGLSALTTKNLALRENMSEALLYKYFGGIDEVLVEVVNYYSKYDESIRRTIGAKDVPSTEKIKEYILTYATYYDNYYAMATLMLQYEELLHNVNTRDHISWCIMERRKFVIRLFEDAINNKEIRDVFPPSELADTLQGIIMAKVLTRRITNRRYTFKQELVSILMKWHEFIKIE